MPVSLKAFLETYPNKTKACLEHICSALGISTNGTVVTLQARIVKYVEDKMKEMKRILEFLNVEPEEKRLSCLQKSNVNIFKRKHHKLNSNPINKT